MDELEHRLEVLGGRTGDERLLERADLDAHPHVLVVQERVQRDPVDVADPALGEDRSERLGVGHVGVGHHREATRAAPLERHLSGDDLVGGERDAHAVRERDHDGIDEVRERPVGQEGARDGVDGVGRLHQCVADHDVVGTAFERSGRDRVDEVEQSSFARGVVDLRERDPGEDVR